MNRTPRPNILLITSHDIGRHLGCYGVSTVATDHIDRIAEEGVRFDNAFATAPLCSPSRASIFTGRCPHSTGVMGLTHGSFGFRMNDDETHLAAYLTQAGYICEHFGVLHECNRSATELGYVAGHNPEMSANASARLFAAQIDTWSQTNSPWYAHIGFFEPHTPFDWGGALPDASRGVTVPQYIASSEDAKRSFSEFQGAIRQLDEAVGCVLTALDTSGEAENTIVIFTADHGIPYPHAKGTLYDNGLEVALLVRWPQRGWTGGRVVSNLVSHIDHLPTLLEITGMSIPDRVQGHSYVRYLDEGEASRHSHEVFGEITYFNAPMYQPRRSIRTETHRLLCNFTNDPPLPIGNWHRGVCVIPELESRWSHVVPYGAVPPVELYDVVADQHCMLDLADEPACETIRARLTQQLHDWMLQTDDPLLTGVPMPPCHERSLQALRASSIKAQETA
ncbi:sulfatase family protein [Mucisphaera sp.]|uniref:sulfatase family protein n=1 Tax=Mucisphaera sp. TaxID=2913024 RepID=UPI003D11B555